MRTLSSSNEEARIKALRQYAILDTMPEEAYDQIVRAAARLCKTNYALIGFVDEDRVWFKANYGLDIAERPRGGDPCSIIVQNQSELTVDDLCLDPRFVNSYLLSFSPPMRYFHGMPIQTKNGSVIGSLCILDKRPRKLSSLQKEMLHTLSQHVMSLLENSYHSSSLEKALIEQEWAADEFSVQHSILNAVVEGTSDAIFVKDTAGKYLKVNPSAEQLLGRPAVQILGDDARSMLVPAEAMRSMQRDQEVLRTGRPQTIEEVVTIRGNVKVYQTSKSVYRDENGKIRGVVDITRDITERKKSQESVERHLRRLAALRSIDMAINASLDLRLTLDILLDQVISQLNIEHASILLFNPYTQTLDRASQRGFSMVPDLPEKYRLGEGYAGIAALEQSLISIPYLSNPDTDGSVSILCEEDIGYFAVPLLARGQVKGVLELCYRSPRDFDSEWRNFLDTLSEQAAIAIDNTTLFEELQRSNTELSLAYEATIEGWSSALDLRDRETVGHCRRVTDVTLQLAQILGIEGASLTHIRHGSLLHDIGKMAIPDNILFKPGPLTDEEWVVMKKHPIYAYEMLSRIDYLHNAIDIPFSHHEKWDGSGYPRGLKQDQIPLAARIFAVVDVWDALRSDRPYRPGWPLEKVRKYIEEQIGIHFDPEVARIFLQMERSLHIT